MRRAHYLERALTSFSRINLTTAWPCLLSDAALVHSRRMIRSSRAAGSTHPSPPSTAVVPLRATALPHGIASMWLAATSNKMLQPHHVSPNSKKIVWWSCAHCHQQFSRRVDLHVRARGVCPKCGLSPPMMVKSSAKPHDRSVVHTSRPKSTLLTLEALNGNRVQKSVADDNYLREHERRILLPMLAKNFEKERSKIAENEVLLVSPKLDGIRCVVSYNQKSKRLLFFSRAGTMFECCDQHIEPALQRMFQKDPKLVLDGELYNDSLNQHRIRGFSVKDQKNVSWLQANAVVPTKKGKKERQHSEEAISFELLTSAIRTTRARRTPEIEALQGKLQYHIFDVLYAQSLRPGYASFSERYRLLERLFHEWGAGAGTSQRKHSRKEPDTSDGAALCPVLRLVPVRATTVKHVPDLLQQAVKAGYEGVMVRRESLRRVDNSAERVPDDSDRTGGYAYGQRSGTLLKYKLMQDDEFVIVDAVEGKGKWKGCLGAFICLAKNKHLTFSVSPAIPEEQKRAIWSRSKGKEFFGKALTVQFQEWTPDGLPRFPVGKGIRGSSNKKDWI